MPFSKWGSLSRSISSITCNVPASWIRLVCLIVFFAVVLFSLPGHLKHDSANAQSASLRRTQGVASRHLPDLNEIYGNVASGVAREEHGLNGLMPVAAQISVVTVNPGAYETPDSGQGGLAVSVPSNIGHASTVVTGTYIEGEPEFGSQTASCRWFGFPAVNGVKSSVKLKIDYTSSGFRVPNRPFSNTFTLSYSLNGGAGWTNAVSRSNFTSSESGTFILDLPISQDLTQVQVRDFLWAFAGLNGGANARATVSNIRIEVETDITPPVISNVAAGGITKTGATITWNTNENSDSQVEYGTTGYTQSTALNPSPVTAHSQDLSGLAPGQLYHYRVKSRDANGNLAVSGDFTFTTLDGNDAAFVSQSVQATMTAGETYPVTISMRNQGTTTWTPGQAYRLGSQNPQDNTTWMTTNRVGLSPGASVSPGATATFSFVVTAPSSPGSYNFQWQMVQDGVEWFGVKTPNLAVQVVPRVDQAQFVSQSVPSVMTRQNAYSVSVTMKNTGNIAWDSNYRLGSQSPQDNNTWGLGRVSLASGETILPGGSKTFTFTVTAPASLGSYALFQWRMVHEGVQWFGDYSFGVVVSLSPGNLNMALIDPFNRIGSSPGADLLSRNYNWSLPLLSLPGRAGLDLGLALSLNSLIYTRAGSVMHFDPHQGYPAPGFSMGFPEIRNAFTNTEANAQSYLLTMPSGRRVEFRQTNPGVYDAVDSSYMRLTHDPINLVFILYTTDGTQCKFVDVTGSGDYKCVQIKDRNGNYITIVYGSLAEIRTITDTLGRVINFNYDSVNHPTSITQNWGGQTHIWATFAYGTKTIHTNFQGLTLNGTANDTQESVLLRVGLADGSVYSFEYNTYAQVKTIRRYAPKTSNPVNFPDDYFPLAYTTYGLPDDDSSPQMDCPRITSRTDWAYDWNNFNEASSTYDPSGGYAWGQVTFPDGTRYKEFFATTGWQRGLTVGTETWSREVTGEVRKKWTELQWTQDNTSVAYPLNPRVTETNVYDDANNRRRTRVEYTDFGLPRDVSEYESDGTTVMRRTHTDYKLSAVYTDRRIIGLPSAQLLYDGANNLFSKVDYQYDLGGGYQSHQGPPVQHDTANYGSGFVQGRGNLNIMRRWDVTDPDNDSKASEYETGYNTSGSVIFTRDPMGHPVSIIYDDSFSDGQNRNTYAYPTTVTDPDNFSSTVQYNYFFGAVTRTEDPKHAVVTRTYDALGRLDRVTNQINGAYTRYDYGLDQRYIATFTTVNDLSSEFFQYSAFDGHGTLHFEASEHPGSVGGYKAVVYEHDNMRRLARQSNPTEVAGNWVPAGDDASAGWRWREQSYDWKGRLTGSTNQDGTTRSASYEGCGCSGGDVVTFMDEGTLVNGTIERRKQKIYHDVLGRVVKTEIYDWNNNVYTTTTNVFNVRDQATTVIRQQGISGASQVTTFSYDGHGRLSTRQLPSESAPSSLVYNADDSLQIMTDARGASSAYSYNNRHQVTRITYGAPGGVAATPNVTFGYDEAGNQTSMTDGLGSATYHYDVLSRIDWETRVFTGVGSFTINYTYNLVGQLTSVTDPANDGVTYAYNNAGQIAAVNGSNYGGVTQYASGLQFRAWGGLKAISYGNGLSLSNTYNSRLQLQQMEVKGTVSSGSPSLMKTQYQYYPDGTPKYTQDMMDSRFDRAWTYDFVGRLSVAYTGQEADNYAGVSVPVPNAGPYLHTHQYDVWNNLTSRIGRYWSQTTNFTTTYNSQNQQQGWTYDASGNLLNDTTNQYTYDAAGRNVSGAGVIQSFDGLGRTVKRITGVADVTYYLYSTPMGGKLLTELFGGAPIQQPPPLGSKIRGYVYAGGVVIARQDKSGGGLKRVEWEHQDRLTGSLATSRNGLNGSVIFGKTREPDPMGADVGLNDPLVEPPLLESGEIAFSLVDDNLFPSGRCTVDGAIISCASAGKLLQSGAAVVAPPETTKWNFAQKRFEFFRATAEGSGWADSSGHWVENTSSHGWVAKADVKDENGTIHHKGEWVFTTEGEDIWTVESQQREYVSLVVGDLIGGWGQEDGGGVRGRQVLTPKQKRGLPSKECVSLLRQIYDRAKELYERRVDFLKDKYHLGIRGNKDPKGGDLDGHIEQFKGKQTNLDRLLDDYNRGNCNGRGGSGSEDKVLSYGRLMLDLPLDLPQPAYGPNRPQPVSPPQPPLWQRILGYFPKTIL